MAGSAVERRVGFGPAADSPAPITIDYPESGSIFPPEFVAPTFQWRDPAPAAKLWRIDAHQSWQYDTATADVADTASRITSDVRISQRILDQSPSLSV